MKKAIKHLSLILLMILMIIITGCTDPSEAERRQETLHVNRDKLHLALESCTGSCLTWEELAQVLYNYEKVQEKWSGVGFSDYEFKIPELQLVTPGKHEHDENTRYEVTILGKDENGFETGLKVSVMEDTSACKFEEPEGLPVEEIVGTYVVKADVTVNVKDKDDKEGEETEVGTQEMEFTYIIAVVDGNRISIETQGIKAAEGVYDPATGVCDFTISQDRTERFTFSKQDGKVQFKSIQLGKENAVPAIGIKVE